MWQFFFKVYQNPFSIEFAKKTIPILTFTAYILGNTSVDLQIHFKNTVKILESLLLEQSVKMKIDPCLYYAR